MDLFKKKLTPKEQMRQNDGQLRKVGRDLEREKRQLEQQEKSTAAEIKKMAAAGNKEACAVLAKQLIQIRKQKTRLYTASSKVQSVGTHAKSMQAGVTLAGAMGSTAKTMSSMNQMIKPAEMAKTMKQFEMEAAKLGMTDELVSDTLDDILNESGDEEESNEIVQKVLDEIGIDISGKLAAAPHPGSQLGEAAASKSKLPTDEEIEAQLAKLRS